ncbi:MAG: hypothetical protein K2J46_00785, partial [Muribaculaceae bacterium]|nr:hypothetical protein [Muribaculaceae bacterium]
ANPAHAIIAVNDWGNLDLSIIFVHITLPSLWPKRIPIISSKGIWTEPKRRFSMKNPAIEIPSNIMRTTVLLLLISKYGNIPVCGQVTLPDGIRG